MVPMQIVNVRLSRLGTIFVGNVRFSHQSARLRPPLFSRTSSAFVARCWNPFRYICSRVQC